MGNIGLSELLVIFLLLSLVFGASRLPALGESLGKTIRSFKRGLAQDEHIEVSQADKLEPKQVPSRASSQQGPVSDAEIVEEPKQAPAQPSSQQAMVSDAEIIEEHKR